MTDPISLRNVPPELLRLAHTLSVQLGASVATVLRLALSSGLLVEATKVAPDQAGMYAGLDGDVLAKALRRHLASAIDVLVEYGQHPYHPAFSAEQPAQRPSPLQSGASLLTSAESVVVLDPSLGDDLEALGLGRGLAETGA
jgi:hypothetical protein